MSTERCLGSTLRVGDVIEVWWQPNRDTIIALRPYTGPLKHLWKHGAQIADFAILETGMTIDNGAYYAHLASMGPVTP